MTTRVNYRMIDGEYLNIKDFGAKGDGVTNDTAAIQHALSLGKPIYFPEGNYAVNERIDLDTNTKIKGDGRNNTFITAIGGSGLTMLGTNGNVSNVEVKGISLDAGFFFESCAYLSNITEGHFEDIRVRNPIKQTVNNYRGGLLFLNSSFITVEKFRAFGIAQSENHLTHEYQSLSFVDCIYCWVNNAYVTQSDKCYHVGGTSQDIYFNGCSANNTYDNGLYLIGDAKKVSFTNFHLESTQEGIVMNSNLDDNGIIISDGSIINSSSRALAPRTGSGYSLSNIYCDGCYSGLSQSTNPSYAGVKGLTASNITIKNCTTERALFLVRNENWNLNNIKITNPPTFTGNDVCRISEDCDNIFITDIFIDASANPQLYGIYIAPETGGAPKVFVDGYYMDGITNSEFVTLEQSETSLVYRGFDRKFNSNLQVVANDSASIGVLSTDDTVGAGQVIGEYYHEQSDISGSGPGKVFSMNTYALTAAGSTHNTDFIARDGEVAARIVPGGAMTIVLPTSSTGLPSGAIWNNGGTIAIVP